ncbi:hypothetical protein BST61_g8007 [Cercospora zeina]
MLTDTPTNRFIIRSVITFLQSYAPFCLGYVVWSLVAAQWPAWSLGFDDYLHRTWMWGICLPEALFYSFFLWYKRHIQKEAIHPPVKTRQERQDLFNKCQREIHDPISFLSGWFRGARVEDIGRQELRKFVDWSFWEGRAEVASEEDGDNAEIEEYMNKMEIMMPQPFQKGPGKARSLRLTLDPIEIEPRSLLWYSLIMLVDTITQLLLYLKGYSYYRRTFWKALAVFPPRPAAFFTRKTSVAPKLSYFLREHTSKTRLPVVYIHGIGIGLLPSVTFLDELNHDLNDDRSEDDQVGILALEVLQISSRLTESIPARAEFLAQLTTVINHHFGEGRFVLGAHSYGTVLSAQILRDKHLCTRISGTLLVDPVTCMLHMPDVAYNFTCRPPVRAPEWLLWYFASKDPQIAHTLGRHFFWTENVLWRDQIDHLIENHGMRFTASISSDDLILNANAVRAYLENGTKSDPVITKDEEGRNTMELEPTDATTSKPWRGSGLETLWWQGHDHGDVYVRKDHRARLIKVIEEYCRGK